MSRRGRSLVAESPFERGPELSLRRGPTKPLAGHLLLCAVDGRGAAPLEDLGRADRARDVIRAMLVDRDHRPGFEQRLEDEAAGAAELAARLADERADLRSRATFTVDPKSARDFDDAISAEGEGEGWRLWIHIADVAAHVRPGTALDREAAARGNSTYAPGVVRPMLPKALSSGHCSLKPGVDRLAVTAEIELTADGTARSTSFYRSRIRSDARLDYEQLDAIFAGAEAAPDAVAEPLRLARAAAGALGERRAGSSLTVAGSEPEIELDDAGRVAAAKASEDTEAHRLIERLMVLTNEQVAELCERRRLAIPFRVHEQPDPDRIELLVDQLAELELPTPPLQEPRSISPHRAGKLAIEASELVAREAKRRGHGAEPWSTLVLRALKPAYYSADNLGHAGLGSSAYAHFTSPIRRYPDLLVHRALLAALGADEVAPEPSEVEEAAAHCSETERGSMRIERDGDDVALSFLLEAELGQRGWATRYGGEVSGVVGAGAFVRFAGERSDAYEGFLPARLIPGDRYELEGSEVSLVGLRSGRRIAIGDPVEIMVERIEPLRGRVDLRPADAPERRRGRGQRRGRGRRGKVRSGR